MAYKQIRRRMKQEVAENDGATHEVHQAPDLSQIQTDRELMTPNDAFALQDVIGNRATGQILNRQMGEETPSRHLAPSQPRTGYVQSKPIPPQPRRPESSPDAPAYAHLRRKPMLQRASWDGSFDTNTDFENQVNQQRGGGKPLPRDVCADLEPKFGADFSGVKVHTDAKAAQLSQDVGAQAFTHGNDIYFNQGKYNPESSSGKHLLAHELTHTVQQGGSKTKKAQAKPQIQRKLKGLHGALSAVSEHGRGWKKILKALFKYETLEAQQLTDVKQYDLFLQQDKLIKPMKDQSSQKHSKTDAHKKKTQIGQNFITMRELLKDIEQLALNWLGRSKHTNSVAEKTVKRMDALKMLLPRIKLEQQEINQVTGTHYQRFLEPSASGNLTVIEEKAVGGMSNQLDKVSLGNTPGFFLEDKTQHDNPVATGIGIGAKNPNFGARSMAMYRIDQLLNMNVLAKTQFAVSNRTEGGQSIPKMGIFMHEAKGKDAQSVGNEGTLDMTSPVLQQGLVKLQMLDVICGQVDRNLGNFFINRNRNGQVIGVEGIDNDLAFGAEFEPLDKRDHGKYRGIPPVVDRGTAEAILRLDPRDLRDALMGLLSDEEVNHTINRLEQFKQHLVTMRANGLFVDDWGGQENMEKLGSDNDSYFGRVRDIHEVALIRRALEKYGARDVVQAQAIEVYQTQEKDLEKYSQSEDAKELYEIKLKMRLSQEETIQKFIGDIAAYLYNCVIKGQITLEQALELAKEVSEMQPRQNAPSFFASKIDELN